MTQEKTSRERVQLATQKLQTVADQIHNVFEPQWNARVGILKTIITLSSGSIVLINTFSSSFHTVGSVSALWWWLVLSSFVLLVLALMCAFAALWTGSAVYGLKSDIYTLCEELTNTFEDAESQEEFVKTFHKLLDKRFDPLVRSDNWAGRLLTCSSVCFCIAILLIAALGIRQFTL